MVWSAGSDISIDISKLSIKKKCISLTLLNREKSVAVNETVFFKIVFKYRFFYRHMNVFPSMITHLNSNTWIKKNINFEYQSLVGK